MVSNFLIKSVLEANGVIFAVQEKVGSKQSKYRSKVEEQEVKNERADVLTMTRYPDEGSIATSRLGGLVKESVTDDVEYVPEP